MIVAAADALANRDLPRRTVIGREAITPREAIMKSDHRNRHPGGMRII